MTCHSIKSLSSGRVTLQGIGVEVQKFPTQNCVGSGTECRVGNVCMHAQFLTHYKEFVGIIRS